jgi:hypothetical protein
MLPGWVLPKPTRGWLWARTNVAAAAAVSSTSSGIASSSRQLAAHLPLPRAAAAAGALHVPRPQGRGCASIGRLAARDADAAGHHAHQACDAALAEHEVGHAVEHQLRPVLQHGAALLARQAHARQLRQQHAPQRHLARAAQHAQRSGVHDAAVARRAQREVQLPVRASAVRDGVAQLCREQQRGAAPAEGPAERLAPSERGVQVCAALLHAAGHNAHLWLPLGERHLLEDGHRLIAQRLQLLQPRVLRNRSACGVTACSASNGHRAARPLLDTLMLLLLLLLLLLAAHGACGVAGVCCCVTRC